MSMSGMAAAERRAAGALDTAATITVTARARRFLARSIPRRPDGWSILLALLVTGLVPLWFYFSYRWNPNYTPIRPEVWAVPGVLCLFYAFVQLWCLILSLFQSEKMGMGDLFIAGISFVVPAVTLAVMVTNWKNGTYNMGTFQLVFIMLILTTTACEFFSTMGIRMLVNRRSIIAPSDQQPHGHEHSTT